MSLCLCSVFFSLPSLYAVYPLTSLGLGFRAVSRFVDPTPVASYYSSQVNFRLYLFRSLSILFLIDGQDCAVICPSPRMFRSRI